MEVIFIFKVWFGTPELKFKIWVRSNQWLHVFFSLHISSRRVKISCLPTENQLPGLPESALDIYVDCVVGCGWVNQLITHSQLKLRLSWAVTKCHLSFKSHHSMIAYI